MIRTLFAFLLLCSPVLAQTPAGFPQRPAPYQRNGSVERFNAVEVADANDFQAAYAAWAIQQNAIAYENAARLRDEVNGGGVSGTVVNHSQVYGWSTGLRGGFNNFSTRQFSTFAPGCTPFGGGPVWIINPFCPPPMPAE